MVLIVGRKFPGDLCEIVGIRAGKSLDFQLDLLQVRLLVDRSDDRRS